MSTATTTTAATAAAATTTTAAASAPATAASWSASNRLGGLRRFAVAITLFNVLGHTIFGFEQSWLQPFVALAVAYVLELLLEAIDAGLSGRPARFRGGFRCLVDFLLSAHITALAVTMLLYANDRLMPVAFGTAVAIGSKAIFRAPAGRGTRHFLNPSNFGITVTLLLFPWVGIAPPYHFTENLFSVADWVLPGVIVVSGTFLNLRYTKRLPLLLAWVAAFFLQAALRHVLFDAPLAASLLPMTGVAFVLYTFYMVTDPATTPSGVKGQIVFGGLVGAVYGALLMVHVVFGFFFALTIVCAGRGLLMYARALAPATAREPAVATAVVGEG